MLRPGELYRQYLSRRLLETLILLNQLQLFPHLSFPQVLAEDPSVNRLVCRLRELTGVPRVPN